MQKQVEVRAKNISTVEQRKKNQKLIVKWGIKWLSVLSVLASYYERDINKRIGEGETLVWNF